MHEENTNEKEDRPLKSESGLKIKAVYAIILVIAILTRIVDLDRIPLQHDAAEHSEWARHIVTGDLGILNEKWKLLFFHPDWGIPDHQPLYIWLMSASFTFFGVSDWSARLPASIAGILCVAVAYKLGETISNPSVGLTSAALLATCPLHIWLSREARPYTLSVLVSYSAILLLCRVVSTKNRRLRQRYSALLGLFFGLTFLTRALEGLILTITIVLFLLSSVMQNREISLTEWGKKNSLPLLAFILFAVPPTLCTLITSSAWFLGGKLTPTIFGGRIALESNMIMDVVFASVIREIQRINSYEYFIWFLKVRIALLILHLQSMKAMIGWAPLVIGFLGLLFSIIYMRKQSFPLILWVILNFCFLMFGLYWYYPKGFGPYPHDVWLLGEHIDIWTLPRYDLSATPALLSLGSDFLYVTAKSLQNRVNTILMQEENDKRKRFRFRYNSLFVTLVFFVLLLSINTILPAATNSSSITWLPEQVQSEIIASQLGVREASLFVYDNAPPSSAVICGPEVGWPLVWYSRHKFRLYLEVFDPFQDARDTLVRTIRFASDQCTDTFLIFREFSGYEENWPWITHSSDHRYHEAFLHLYPALQPVETVRLNENRSILIYHLPKT